MELARSEPVETAGNGEWCKVELKAVQDRGRGRKLAWFSSAENRAGGCEETASLFCNGSRQHFA